VSVSLVYGQSRRFSFEMDATRIVASRPAPPPLPDPGKAVERALEQPLDFPPLARAVVPGDRIVLAMDRHVPQAACLIKHVWRVLEGSGIRPEDVLILQPAGLLGEPLADPRHELPESARTAIHWKVHDPTAEDSQAYLATTAAGERIYLSRELIDADLVISIGEIAFDPLLGYRGTGSVYYPGLSSTEAVARAHGQGHRELGPDDARPLRQMIDEISWLLGTQFTIQVVAAEGTGVAEVLAGLDHSVLDRGKAALANHWLVRLRERPQTVVIAVDQDAAGHGWEQLGAALATARNLVEKDGRIVILSELAAELKEGMTLLRESEDPRDALKPLRQKAPPDLLAATQVAASVDWARVYLLSQLPSDLVEELFMVPLQNEKEVERLLAVCESCLFLGGAQHTYGQIESA